jgi:glycosyltransferase involved in cell wall biosynthesis
MRILAVHNRYLFPGGEDQVFAAEVALLQQHGHDVSTWVEDNARLNQQSSLAIAANSVWSRASQRHLQQLLLEHQPEVVHFHNTFLRISPAAYYTCQAASVAVVQTLHNYRLLCPAATFFRDGRVCEDCLGKTGLWSSIQHGCWHSRSHSAVVAAMLTTHRWLQTWQKQIDLFIVMTEFARQKYIGEGFPAAKMVVKPNFIASSPHLARPAEQKKFALFVGRLSTEKGLEVLVEAWQSLPNMPLKIVGDGPLRSMLEQVIQKSGLNHIELLGARTHDDVLALMEQARFLVVPSTCYEGMPMALLEAFSQRLPVLVSKLGSMAEIVRHNENGIHFTANDASDLATWARWAWERPRELETMADHAYRDYESIYSPSANYDMLMEIYQRAIKSHRVAS